MRVLGRAASPETHIWARGDCEVARVTLEYNTTAKQAAERSNSGGRGTSSLGPELTFPSEVTLTDPRRMRESEI